MRVAAADDRLLGGDDVVRRDRGRVIESVDFLDALAGQGVHEPRLAARELPDLGKSHRLEDLPRRLGVLRIEGGDLRLGEVAQHQVLRDDVEGTDLAERLAIRANLRFVVAHVQHSDEGDGDRERNGIAVHVAVAELSQKGNQHRSGKAVRLVEEHRERLAEPAAELPELVAHRDRLGRVGSRRFTDASVALARLEILREHLFGIGLKQSGDRRRRPRRVRGVLQRLQRAVERDHLALVVDLAGERLERGRLAGLPRRMDDEIRLLPDEAPDLRHPVERGEHVVVGGEAGPRDVEGFFHGAPPCR